MLSLSCPWIWAGFGLTVYAVGYLERGQGGRWLWEQRSLKVQGRCRWLTPVILATQEAEFRRIEV
jgi:hypothetical protein